MLRSVPGVLSVRHHYWRAEIRDPVVICSAEVREPVVRPVVWIPRRSPLMKQQDGATINPAMKPFGGVLRRVS